MDRNPRLRLVPLFSFVSEEELLHLLAPEVNFVLVVAFDRLRLIHRVIQSLEELFEGLHHRWRRTQVQVMDIPQPGRQKKV